MTLRELRLKISFLTRQAISPLVSWQSHHYFAGHMGDNLLPTAIELLHPVFKVSLRVLHHTSGAGPLVFYITGAPRTARQVKKYVLPEACAAFDPVGIYTSGYFRSEETVVVESKNVCLAP